MEENSTIILYSYKLGDCMNAVITNVHTYTLPRGKLPPNYKWVFNKISVQYESVTAVYAVCQYIGIPYFIYQLYIPKSI